MPHTGKHKKKKNNMSQNNDSKTGESLPQAGTAAGRDTIAATVPPQQIIETESLTVAEEGTRMGSSMNRTSFRQKLEKEDLPHCPDIPDVEDFDEDEIFCRMATDENIFNNRGLSHAPKMEESNQERYRQMSCCAQMHSYEWTKLFPRMSSENEFPIVQVRFKNTHKDFFRIPENENPKLFQTGDIVTVESANGHDTGIICLRGELVRIQLKKKGLSPDSPTIRKIYRKARQNDIDKWIETIQAEKEMQRRARIIAAQLGLSMKINNVEIQGDFTKAIFYYTADDRVDFRQLIKLYAEEFKLRIEMRQIGARQESGLLGGIGSCGRELCCVTFLHNFTSVGTHTARVQQVSLNPQKLAGQCSKLKCCLNFEYDVYMDALKSMPDAKTLLKTDQGDAHCVKMDPLKRVMTFTYNDNPGIYTDLPADTVFEIIEKNKAGETVSSLSDFAQDTVAAVEPAPEFQQVVGQDDLTRFDKPKEQRKQGKENSRPAKKKNVQTARKEEPASPKKQDTQRNRQNHSQESKKKNNGQPDTASVKSQRAPRPLQKPILKARTNDGNNPAE